MSNETVNRISNVEFVKALKVASDEGQTLEDVAVSLGRKVESIYQRYNKLRKAGVAIPDIPLRPRKERGAQEIDVDSLNAIFS